MSLPAGRRGRNAAAWLAWLAAGSLLLGGCGLLGRPQPLSADAPLDMSVTSPEFAGGVIPAQFTCHGKGQSPPIFWSGAPAGTKSLALVVDDSAAPISPRVYWIVFDIGPGTTDLQAGPPTVGKNTGKTAGTLPSGARVAYNSAGTAGYSAPCPKGKPHSYRFTVYALDTFLGSSLPNQASLLQAWSTIAQHVIARGTLTARANPRAG